MTAVVTKKKPGRPAPKAARATSPARAHPYRMKDLSKLTGLPRQVIHFYIQQGLVPEGHKTGRNMAYYDDAHVARIKLVRQLQHERFLPLKAIRAVLGETRDPFTHEQRQMLLEVKERLAGVVQPAPGYVDAREVLARDGVRERDLRELVALGVVAAIEGERGARGKKTLRIAAEDVWFVEMYGQLRALGFSEALGFVPKDALVMEEAVQRIFEWERTMLAERLARVPAAQVAFMVERALPILNAMLVRSHERRVRTFFAQLGG